MHIYLETSIFVQKNELTETDLQNQNFYQLILSYYYKKTLLPCQQELTKEQRLVL